MSEETNNNETEVTTTETTSQQQSEEERLQAIVAKRLEAKKESIKIKSLEKQAEKKEQHEINKILVKKAFEGGLTDAPRIGKAISMSENGVRRYCDELGLRLVVTKAERRRMALEAQRDLAEDAERMKYGITRGE